MAQPTPYYRIEDLKVGQRFSWRRTVTQADLDDTVQRTGDHGGYHVDEAWAKRAGFRTLITPGMFQAAMVTKLGGDLNLLARKITFSFDKPVYVGDTLEAEVTVTLIELPKNRITLEGKITNQAGVVVLTCTTVGYLPKPEWGAPDKSRVD